ncbi:hypothetical protein NMY22_g17763 [Coprinellus aureogranulatus]|nr:hypothetical protein NMY22_g17763 [Coprinellus aureogranulatus]
MNAVPADAGPLREMIHLQLRAMWGLPTADSVPCDPNPDVLTKFNNDFDANMNIMEHLRDGRPFMIDPTLVRLNPVEIIKDGGRVENAMLKVEQSFLEFTRATIARFGLASWGPDLRQSAYSHYNNTNRAIAIETIKQALMTGAYKAVFPKLNGRYASNTGLIIQIYDHFVFHVYRSRYRSEIKKPGSAKKARNRGKGYKGRERLKKAREKFLRDNGFPPRYIRLIVNEAMSEDEKEPGVTTDDGDPVYVVRRVIWRSERFEKFIRTLDDCRLSTDSQWPGRRTSERVRRVPPLEDRIAGQFKRLPESFPIEGYDPKFYNGLAPALRARCAFPEVILPRNMDDLFKKQGDELLSSKELNPLRRKKVLKEYKYVRAADLDAADEDLCCCRCFARPVTSPTVLQLISTTVFSCHCGVPLTPRRLRVANM